MSRYKVGDTVYFDSRPVVIKTREAHRFSPIYLYTFENNIIRCSAVSFTKKPNGNQHTLSQVMKFDTTEEQNDFPTCRNHQTGMVNYIAFSKGSLFCDSLEQQFVTPEIAYEILGTDVFFRPDRHFIHFIGKLAAGRLVIDLGAGQGDLVKVLSKYKYRSMGIEKHFDRESYLKWCIDTNDFDSINKMLQYDLSTERGLNFLKGLAFKDKAIFIIARPDEDFPLHEVTDVLRYCEVYLIDVNPPEYWGLEGDLIEHKGISQGNEKIWKLL